MVVPYREVVGLVVEKLEFEMQKMFAACVVAFSVGVAKLAAFVLLTKLANRNFDFSTFRLFFNVNKTNNDVKSRTSTATGREGRAGRQARKTAKARRRQDDVSRR